MPDPKSYHEELLAEPLHAVFGDLDATALALLREHLHWVALAGGQTLMAEGEVGDSMYLAVSGRLRAYLRQDDGTLRMVREMSRAEIIGEMSLISDEPRSATVVAIRDSVLVRLDKAQFLRLIELSPAVAVVLARQIIRRLKTEHKPSACAAPVTTGILPITPGVVDAAAFASQLAHQLDRYGRVCVVDASLMAQGRAPAEDPTDAQRQVAMDLDRIEAGHQFVLRVGDREPTA